MKKAYLVCNLARQVEGDIVHFMIEYVSFNKEKAETFLKSRPLDEAIEVNGIKCVSLRSGIEIDIEE